MKNIMRVKIDGKFIRAAHNFPKEILSINSNIQNTIQNILRNDGINNLHTLIFKPVIIQTYTKDGKFYENTDTVKSIAMIKRRPNQISPDYMLTTERFNIQFPGNAQKILVKSDDNKLALLCFNFPDPTQTLPSNDIVNEFIKQFNKPDIN